MQQTTRLVRVFLICTSQATQKKIATLFSRKKHRLVDSDAATAFTHAHTEHVTIHQALSELTLLLFMAVSGGLTGVSHEIS